MSGISSLNFLGHRKLPVDERRTRALNEYLREQHTERKQVGYVGAPPLQGEDRICGFRGLYGNIEINQGGNTEEISSLRTFCMQGLLYFIAER